MADGGRGDSRGHGPQFLRSFVNHAFAVTVVVLSIVSAIVQLKDMVSWSAIVIAGLAIFAITGWLAAVYVAYNSKFVVSAVEALLKSISERITELPFADSWLRAALLNQRAVDIYWHDNKSLRINRIVMRSFITERDVRNVISIAGINDTREDVNSCPMLLIGGSVLHFNQFTDIATVMVSETQKNPMKLKPVLDLGELHLAEMIFPTMLRRRQSFEIQHEHYWPGAMTPGADVMWYPYASLFEKGVDEFVIEVKFHAKASFVRGYVGNMDRGTCVLSTEQPSPVSDEGNEFRWTVDPVSNREIYALVFDR